MFQRINVPKRRSTILVGRLWSQLATEGNHSSTLSSEKCAYKINSFVKYVDVETWKWIELFYFRLTKLRLHLKSILTNFYIVVSFAIIVLFRYNEKFAEGQGDDSDKFGEGCFCPEGTTLFSSNSDLCVSSCKTIFVLNTGHSFVTYPTTSVTFVLFF